MGGRTKDNRILSVVFLLASVWGQASFASDSNSACEIFLKQQNVVRRNLRLFRFNRAENDRVLNEVAGVQYLAEDSLLSKLPGEAAKDAEDKNLKKVLAWFERYEGYNQNLERLSRAIGRFIGEESSRRSSSKAGGTDSTDWDPAEALLRQKGRIKIVEEALENPNTSYPVLLVFPRSARRVRDAVILQRVSSLMVQKSFADAGELKAFLKNDLRELGQLQGYVVEREIEQAELFVRIRQFLGAFPPGSFEKLRTRLSAAEKMREEAVARGESPVDPKQDPFYARDYAIVDLFQRANNIVYGNDPKFADLRPSKRSLDFIEALTNSNDSNQVLKVQGWEPAVRRYIQWSWDWMAAINKYVAWIRQPIVTYSGVLIIASAVSSGLTWSYQKVYRPAHDYMVYNPEEIKAREYFENLIELRQKISDVSVTYKDFYRRFFDYAQANYSDEAITIAFEYLRKIRPTNEADPVRDPGFTAEQLASFTRQAKEIVAKRDALLFGFQSKFGTVAAVQPRLERREKNYFLVEQVWKGISSASSQPGNPSEAKNIDSEDEE